MQTKRRIFTFVEIWGRAELRSALSVIKLDISDMFE